MIRKILIFLIASTLSLHTSLEAAERSFAIIVDSDTYRACKIEIDSYKLLLDKEGLRSFIVDRNWTNPQEVKDELLTLYKNKYIEGAIFIGEIPIPMIRDAQHFTSAFKMDQERYPKDVSSVPSDRFYDDFDLKFDYLSQDSVKRLFHYYSLRWDSPQKISCDIYSGRLKPTKNGEAGYKQIRDYFKKLLLERSTGNKLDVIVSYTGEGSFSNSLTAWKEEGITLREQFPQAFKDKNSAKFLLFHMYPSMKQTIIEELRREDVDFMVFHEHGSFDRQYITGVPLSKGSGENIEAAKRIFRNRLRKEAEGSEKNEQQKQIWMNSYKIDSSWFVGAFNPEQIKKDSLEDISTGIVLEDIPNINPNPRIVVFDACFNGDFREDSFIGGEYIFAKGKTIVAFGNSVNVLQDKSASDLLGLLGLGYSIGEWAKLTNILESHIIGDPTFVFNGDKGSRKVDLKSADTAYWLKILKQERHPDFKGVALHKLFDLNYLGLSNLLLDTYNSTSDYMLRLQVFHLLHYYNDGKFEGLLKTSVYDPYEFIRRKSTYAMGRIGKDEFLPYIASVYINDYLDERVRFNAEFCIELMDTDKLEKEGIAQIESSSSLYNKQKSLSEFKAKMNSRKSISKSGMELNNTSLKMSSRLMGVSTLRNNSYHKMVDSYLQLLANPKEDLNLRIKLAEALGWFTLSHRKEDIIATCKTLSAENGLDVTLKKELLKTVNRLEVYMRLGANAFAKSEIITSKGKFDSRFLIVIDKESFTAVKQEVLDYKSVLESEGLGSVILIGEWSNPEILRAEIKNIYNEKPVLEGAVFIGNIPIVKIRNFQHATSAFKMDEDKFPMSESSVTSDRYYDDLDLEFDFIKQDEKNHSHFYYRLKESSPQVIMSNFYSARMMPPSDMGVDPKELLKKYLRKVVDAHKEINPLDQFVIFNGHGYNSDCLTAWQNEQFAIKEQLPLAFKSSKGNGFYNFRQDPFMKYKLFDKLQQTGTDLFIFHEHGDFDTQYINGDYPAPNVLDGGPISILSTSLRNTYRRYKGERAAAFKKTVLEEYGFTEEFFDKRRLDSLKVSDSLFSADINIVLSDLVKVKMQPRFSIFDACYNGSFNKPGYIAGYHVFGNGRTIVAQGNTVNALQDKWTLELLGMLAEGARVGLWHMETQFLESHLIGDPTYRFFSEGSKRFNDNPNLQALALKQLSKNPPKDFSKSLLKIFKENKYYSVRMEALKRLLDIGDVNTVEAIRAGLDDPYEFIRRFAARFAGYSGDPVLISPLVNTLLFSNESQRVQYAAQSSLQMFELTMVIKEIEKQVASSNLLEKDKVIKDLIAYFKDQAKSQEKSLKIILDKTAKADDRISEVRRLRNYNNHSQVDKLLQVLNDSGDDSNVRMFLAEALGWFKLSIRKGEILEALKYVNTNASSPSELKGEALQSINRL